MAVESKRGCGYRKVGGLYLVGSGGGIACDRLPIELTVCGCCGQGIKQTRGWTWVDVQGLVGGDHMVAKVPNVMEHCGCNPGCPLCHNTKAMGRAGLLWVGTQFYPTIEAFEMEARSLGVSRRVTTLPRGFELGKTWVLFAHPRGIIKATGNLSAKYVPAIFRVWRPTVVERIYTESSRDNADVQADIKRGITPVYVPDNDKDHQGSVYDKEAIPVASVGTTPPLFS